MRKRNQLIVFLLITFAYIFLVLTASTDPAELERYHVTQMQVRLWSVALLVPIVAIWFGAFYGYSKFKNYADTIEDSADGQALQKLSKGLMVLAFSLPTLALVGAIFSHISVSAPEYLGPAVIVRQILNIGFPLLAFVIIGDAAGDLVSQLRRRKRSQQNNKPIIFTVIAASSIFTGFIVALADESARPTNIYSYPIWFVVFAAVIPYLYMWYRGLAAAYNLNFYSKNVHGLIYKQAFNYLSAGLCAVIVVAIAPQMLTVLTPQLESLQFTSLVFFIYVLVAVYAVGYGLIAVGAKRLKRIEEV